MEETIGLIYQLWGEFWNNASTFDKILAISNAAGASYTFVITMLLLQEVEAVDKEKIDTNYVLVKIALGMIMLGCFFSAISIKLPKFYEFTILAGSTWILTHLWYVLRTKRKRRLKSNQQHGDVQL